MKAETEKLIVKLLRADKLALQQMAQAEGEPIAVIVRRIIRSTIRRAKEPTTSQVGEEVRGDGY